MRFPLIALGCLAALMCSNRGIADIVVHQSLASGGGELIPGQSLTTPSGGPWNELKFNWYSLTDGTVATSPTAFGTLFLLSKQYNGRPEDLNSNVPGFIAQSQSISANQYLFDPTVSIQPGAKYFFYANARGVTVATSDVYAGGNFHYAGFGGWETFTSSGGDNAFRLEGTAVPEPSGLLTALAGMLLSCIVRNRGKRPSAT